MISDRLNLLDVHPALYIFRKSLSSCRFNHLMRTSETFLFSEKLQAVDEIFRSTLEVFTNNKLDNFSWDQVSLPLSLGGSGIRKVEDLAMRAYPSSVHSSSIYSSSIMSDKLLQKFDLNELDDHFLRLVESIPPEFVPSSDTLKNEQKSRDLPRTKSKFCSMFDSGEPTTARIAVGLRLGCNLCEKHICVCGAVVRKDGIHRPSCIKSVRKIK